MKKKLGFNMGPLKSATHFTAEQFSARMRGILVVPSRHHCLGAEGSKSRAALDSSAFMPQLLESRSVLHLSGDLFIFFSGGEQHFSFVAEPHFDRTELKIYSWNRTRIQHGSQARGGGGAVNLTFCLFALLKWWLWQADTAKLARFSEETCKLAW